MRIAKALILILDSVLINIFSQLTCSEGWHMTIHCEKLTFPGQGGYRPSFPLWKNKRAIKNCRNSSTLLIREKSRAIWDRKAGEQDSTSFSIIPPFSESKWNLISVFINTIALWIEMHFYEYVQKIYRPTQVCTRPPTHPSVCYSFVALNPHLQLIRLPSLVAWRQLLLGMSSSYRWLQDHINSSHFLL